jgi:proline dehydrogenase
VKELIAEDRWTCPDMDHALARCRENNSKKIRCIVHLFGPRSPDHKVQVALAAHYRELTDTIAQQNILASISIKPTPFGLMSDYAGAGKIILALAEHAAGGGVSFEMDMEGRGTVEKTLRIAISCRDAGYPVTLAVQANLDRTSDDLRLVLSHGIVPRIVKGTYPGDVVDFSAIQDRMKTLIESTITGGGRLQVGTHDPELISWIEERFHGEKERIEMGFLMGLADRTKLRLAGQGWTVSEYIPFGDDGKAYVTRRERYLRELREISRVPAP